MKKHYVVFVLFFILVIPVTNVARAQSVGGVTSGAATYCSNTNSGFISLTGFTGTILNWESSTDGGVTWTNIGNITSTQSYVNLSVSTCYCAVVQNGAFPPDTSSISCITIYAPSNGGTISGGGTYCVNTGPGTLSVSGNTGNILNWLSSTDGGTTWTLIPDTTTTYNYGLITANTIFTAVAQNATCPSDTSSFASFIILPGSVGGIASANDTVCYSANAGAVSVTGITGTVTSWISSTDGGLTWTPVAVTATSLPYAGLTQTTQFAAVVQNATCNADTSTTVTITVLSPPLVFAGNDTTISPGQSVTLNGSGGGTPAWSPSTGLDSVNIFGPLSTPINSITYTLTVIDVNGCSSSDDIRITVIAPVFNGLIAELFTPNGDAYNDTWYIEGIQNYPDCEVLVFNIYGQKVYSQKGYKNDWKGTYNGNDLPDGTYYFILRFDKDDSEFKGSVDILRNK